VACLGLQDNTTSFCDAKHDYRVAPITARNILGGSRILAENGREKNSAWSAAHSLGSLAAASQLPVAQLRVLFGQTFEPRSPPWATPSETKMAIPVS